MCYNELSEKVIIIYITSATSCIQKTLKRSCWVEVGLYCKSRFYVISATITKQKKSKICIKNDKIIKTSGLQLSSFNFLGLEFICARCSSNETARS